MLNIVAYDQRKKTYITDIQVDQLHQYLKNSHMFLWVDFQIPGPEETNLLETVFELDPFAIEDCTHPRQVPKLESFKDYHFYIVQGIKLEEQQIDCQTLQLSGFLADTYLITYHNDAIPAIDHARKRIVAHNSRLEQGSAYLAYEIMDELIDMYLPVLDVLDTKIRKIQDKTAANDFDKRSARKYNRLFMEILDLRRISIRNQQVFYQLSHSNLKFIDPKEARLFRDIYDHVVRVVDTSEYYQQTLQGVLNIHFSHSTSEVNRVLVILTLITTIALPLNVITGIYGMNFAHMPLANNPAGFWIILGLMTAIIILMLYSYRKRGWI